MNPHPKRIIEEDIERSINVSLKFFCTKANPFPQRYFQLLKVNETLDKGEISDSVLDLLRLEFHVFNQKASMININYNLLTFYTGIILASWAYLKVFFTDTPEKVFLTEMPETEKLLVICEGLTLSRYYQNYLKEEKLFYILIEFMRSPEYLLTLTKSSLYQFHERIKNNSDN